MKPLATSTPKVQVLVCNNERTQGKVCCKAVGGVEFCDTLKERIKLKGVSGTICVTRTGCLGHCNDVGCTVVIHRTGQAPQWLLECTKEDLERVWQWVIKD